MIQMQEVSGDPLEMRVRDSTQLVTNGNARGM